MKLLGDLAVGGRRRDAAAADGPAERGEHPELRLAQLSPGRQLTARNGLIVRLVGRVAVDEQGAADSHHIPSAQSAATGDSNAVDIGAVAGQPVVDQQPLAAGVLELCVQPRDLSVETEREVRLRGAPDAKSPALRDDGQMLPSVGIAMNQEGATLALQLELALELAWALPGCR
jgi:hypothetical protein